MHRFVRTELLLGREAMERLRAAHVAVVGMGAVGSFAVEALARAGVGHLRLVDFDTVHLSNLNRQLYALESTLDQPKVELAARRVRDINPACEVEPLARFVDRAVAREVVAPPIGWVIDAIDSLGPKVELIVAAVEAGVPIVSAMGAARKTDPLGVRIGDVFTSNTCPLARFVRRRLKKRGIATGVRCVYSEEPPLEGTLGEAGADGSLERGRQRQPLGSLSCVTGMFGLVAARDVIAQIVGLG